MQTIDETIEQDMDVGTEIEQPVTEGNGLCHKSAVNTDNSDAGLNDVPVYDPYELSKHSDESGQDTNPKPQRKFNTLLFVIISAVVCVLLCRTCDRLIIHPSEFVLGSPPGTFVDEGELQIQNERLRHDVDLFYECLNNIILGKEPDKQIDRFVNNKYGALKDEEQKCVDLLEMFAAAQKEFIKIFVDYGGAWTNSGALAIYSDNWDREHDKRTWGDLVNEAEVANSLLAKGVAEHERKYLAKIEGIIGMQNKKWLRTLHNAFMRGFSTEVSTYAKLISLRSDEVKMLKSLVELYGQAGNFEEKDGQLVFKDDALADKEKKAWQAIDKAEKDIIKLVADAKAKVK